MPLKVKLDPTISSIDIYSTARFMLDKFYDQTDQNYFDFYDVEDQIKSIYLKSMFDNLLNLFNAIGVSFTNNELLVITNVIYRLKGLRESIEYLFTTVLGFDFTLEYDYLTFEFNVTIDKLSIDNLTKFNIYFKNLVDELFYTKSFEIELENLILNIDTIKELSYGISQTYFNDFHIIKTES